MSLSDVMLCLRRYTFTEEGPPAPEPPTHFFSSWLDYYDWRGLPHDSPVSLRLHFPLTVYHMLAQTLGAAAGGLEGLKVRVYTIHTLGIYGSPQKRNPWIAFHMIGAVTRLEMSTSTSTSILKSL